jgi:hypothetical protein
MHADVDADKDADKDANGDKIKISSIEDVKAFVSHIEYS